MVVRHVLVDRADVVYVRGIFEASDGVAAVYSISGGDLTFATTPSRATELDRLLADLKQELGASLRLGGSCVDDGGGSV